MLNNETEKVSFVIGKSIVELRELESDLIERLMRHYDELESITDKLIDADYQATLINNAIAKDLVKLDAVRAEINYQMQNTLSVNTEGLKVITEFLEKMRH